MRQAGLVSVNKIVALSAQMMNKQALQKIQSYLVLPQQFEKRKALEIQQGKWKDNWRKKSYIFRKTHESH